MQQFTLERNITKVQKAVHHTSYTQYNTQIIRYSMYIFHFSWLPGSEPKAMLTQKTLYAKST